MKDLSIIVPMYNSEAFLPKCLDSLLAQDISADRYEIILVNDGSPDGSLAIAEEYASRFKNIVVLSQPNKGTSGARNTGIRHATGQYLYFVDPDDYILENSLKDPLARMNTEDLDILRFDYTEVDEQYHLAHSTKRIPKVNYAPQIMDGESFLSERLGVACYVWAFFFRRRLIVDNGHYFPEGQYIDDTPWLPKVILSAKRIDSFPIKRHFYLIRSESLVRASDSKSVDRQIEGLFFLVSEINQQRDSCRRKKADRWYRMIIAFGVICLLSLIAVRRYGYRQVYYPRLKKLNILPLSLSKASGPTIVKILLINVSPDLFCRLIHLLNRHRYPESL